MVIRKQKLWQITYQDKKEEFLGNWWANNK